MGKLKQQMEMKAELAMMGKFVPVESEDEVRFITTYIINTVAPKEGDKPRAFDEDFDIYDSIHKYGDTGKVTHLGCHTVYGMPTITYCIEDNDVPKPFEEDYGTGSPCSFCYVFNMADHEMCSEFGDCFFQKKEDGYFHRVS